MIELILKLKKKKNRQSAYNVIPRGSQLIRITRYFYEHTFKYSVSF